VKRKKIRCGDYPEIDKAIVIWLKSMRHTGISINGNLFKKKAQQFAENLNISDFCASDGWLDRCKKRNSITFRDIVGESASVSPEMYSEWINFKLPSILQKYESRDVFNLDETSLFYKLMPNKTLSFKNETCSGGKLSKERVTVLLGANSDGSDKLPILVIGKYAKPRVFKNVKTLPLLYSANKKAWMTSSEWEKYVNCLEKKFKKESRHVVFIIDNAPPHLPIEKLQNIEIIYLPPNTTAICQPLDQGIIRNFKLFYRQLVVTEIINRLDQKSQLTAGNVNLNILDAIHFVKKAWDRVKPETIKNCFNKAGFYLGTVSDQCFPELNVDGDDHIIHELWSNPAIAIITNNVDIDQFLNVDSLTSTCGQLSDNDIIDMVQSNAIIDTDSDSEVDIVNSEAIVSLTEVQNALKIVRMFISGQDNTEDEMQKIHSIENYVDAIMYANMKQTKLTSYFKKS